MRLKTLKFSTLILLTIAFLGTGASTGGPALVNDTASGELQAAHPGPGHRQPEPAEVEFMRGFLKRINPGLQVEDPACAHELPRAIYSHSMANGVEWIKVFVLAWQESDFDCHAKNRRDKGGAFGPFQIRRLWEPLIGDPRHLYFEPQLAVDRVVRVVRYYQDTPRYQELIRRGFRTPLLCLYNSGESQRVNRKYCRTARLKMEAVEESWKEFRSRQEMITEDLEHTEGSSLRGDGA
ncbi:MAG: hypothetical protein OEZ59_08535 [Deltaproteobacteria bacterium]|nr:hypothetical protein [Deltaproteobacteria bacterium]